MKAFLSLLSLSFFSASAYANVAEPIHDSTSLDVSPRSFSHIPALFKRVQINLNGFPAEASLPIEDGDMNRFIDQVAELAQYVLDNVHADHALYLRFFGSGTYYNEAMNVIRRIATIRSAGGPPLNINYHNEAGPNDIGPDGQEAASAANYGNINGQPTLNLYNALPQHRDLMTMLPGQTTEGQLERFARTRQGMVLHELFHWAGDNTLWGPVVEDANHPNYPTGTPQRIVDIYLGQAAGGVAADYAFLTQNGADPAAARAYGERNVLLLPQLSFGPELAVQNADTYTLFMTAAWLNWDSRRFAPTHGNAPNNWQGGNFEDPFGGTRSPFGQGSLASNFASGLRAIMVWKAVGRLKGEL